MHAAVLRQFLLTSSSLVAVCASTGGFGPTEVKVHQWVCAILAHMRSKDAKQAA